MNKIIYLDAAASALKPDCVIDTEMNFLRNSYANAGRGVCARAGQVDAMLADARKSVADFISADASQIVFTSGTTDSLNRVVQILANSGRKINKVAVSDLDHHSARMPWENYCKTHDAELLVCNLDDNLDIDAALIPSADVLVITAMSNVLGRAQNVSQIIYQARKKNPDVITVVDAAQYVVHDDIDVKKWDCDFMAFSAHKIGADTGLGILFIKNPDDFMPDKFGGGMVNRINAVSDWVLNLSPDKFEAGTLPLTQIVGLPVAINYLENNRPDLNLIKYLYDRLSKNENIQVITERDSAMFTFVPKNMHVLDFGALIGASGICLRVGNMCASWIHQKLGLMGSVRISVGPWNTMSDVQKAADIIEGIIK